MIYYNLNKEIPAEKILQDIQKLINKENDLSSKILKISLQQIRDSSGDSLLPKIECHGEEKEK